MGAQQKCAHACSYSAGYHRMITDNYLTLSYGVLTLSILDIIPALEYTPNPKPHEPPRARNFLRFRDYRAALLCAEPVIWG